LVGRDGELDAMQRFLAEVHDGSAALVLSGEPGIGKTLLWEAGVALARARGHRVLVHRSVEAEAGFAFTGLADLMAPVVEGVLPALAPPRRRALAVALMLEDPAGAPPDAGAIGLALTDALRRLAAAMPLVVALDDIQWLDSSTARVLPLALRRLEGASVAALTTLRVAPEVRPPFELARTFTRLEEMPLDPLDLGDLHRLLKDRLALELSRPELVRVLETSGGNPFFAIEIGRELIRLRGAIHVPASLKEALGGRLARLPLQTLDVLLAVAASARPTVEVTASAHDAPTEDTLRALGVAARDGVISLEGDKLRFTHPLLASLCYEQAPLWKRRAVHAELAALVDDAEQRARHLALAAEGADAAVAAELDVATSHAAARGATAAAAELAELAAQSTPSGETEARRRRRRAAATFHHMAGDFGRATDLLTGLAEELLPGNERAGVMYMRALIGRDDLPTRVRLAEQALRDAGNDDALGSQILGFLSINRWLMGDVPAGLRDALEGLARAERLGDRRMVAVALGRVGLMEAWAAEVTPGLLERGVEIETTLDTPLMFIESPSFILACRQQENDQLDSARSMIQEVTRVAADRGDEHTRQWTRLQLLLIETHAGRWPLALEHAAEARAIAEQTQEAQYRGMVESIASHVEADTGLIREARLSAECGLRNARSVSDEIHTISNLASLGHLELVLGDMTRAADRLRELPARMAATGYRVASADPSADAIEALVGVGELDRARLYLDELMRIAPRLNRAMRVAAWRSAGLLAAAGGDRTGAIDAFQRGLAADENPPMYPLERARTLLALGAAHRQALQRRAARQTLEQALQILEELGARPWAQKARTELARISGRRAATDDLTGAEQRVALLAARGRQNKEIASELFLTVRTVESHLSRVYRKLGLRSRAELARRFAPQEPVAAAMPPSAGDPPGDRQ
jgi:DNA-binding CsgD family transcriptional regulator